MNFTAMIKKLPMATKKERGVYGDEASHESSRRITESWSTIIV